MHHEPILSDGPHEPTEIDRWRPASWVWLLFWLALGLGVFTQSSSTRWSVPTLAKETAVQRAALKRFESRPIQDIRTGMRVIADNPELNGQEAVESHITPETWRNIHLRIEKPDGGELRITLLRSLDWLQARHVEVGREIDVELKEMGVAGPATILGIEPCPPIEQGPGRVVTGTFCHSAANVIDLYVAGEDTPIGTTANHPFWSETRQDFVQAGSLRPGEQLRTATGKTAWVTKQIPRTDSTPVFNLEVEIEHTYHIAVSGILVHNSDDYVLERGMHFTDKTGAGGARPPRHHIFPQEHRQWFKDRNFDIDKITVELDQGTHSALHSMDWNERLMFSLRQQELELGRDLTSREIWEIGYRQMRQDGIGNLPIIPFFD